MVGGNRKFNYAGVITLGVALSLGACAGDDQTSASNSNSNSNTNTETNTNTDTATNTQSGTNTDSDSEGTGPSGSDTATASGTTDMTTQGPDPSTSNPTTTTNTTTDPTTSGTTTGTNTESDSDSDSDGSSSSTGPIIPCEPGDGMMMGDVEKSYLWVANSNQDTISKVDTQAVVELARYRSDPGNGDPSRTAVSADGRFVVVNNRATGRVTAIAANEEDCVDRNNDGNITTSQNPNDILAWPGPNVDSAADECIVWSTVLPASNDHIGAGPRGVTWTLGEWSYDSCSFENPKVWVGFRPQVGISHMSELDGATGAVEDTVEINPWNAGSTTWGPYGAALDYDPPTKDQRVYFTGLRGNVYAVNTQDNTYQEWSSPPNTQSYGMSMDPQRRVWMGGCVGPVTRFDPADQTFTAVPGTNDCYRGVGADTIGNIWVAVNFQCGVVQIDADTATVVQFHTLNPCSTPVGVSLDDEGFIWIVDQGTGAWKIDPADPNNKQFLPIAGNHYTYSDMTGGQLNNIIIQ